MMEMGELPMPGGWTLSMAWLPVRAALRRHALARTAPVAFGAVVVLGGTFQFTAWMRGLRLGPRCSLSCAGLTAILLATGVMNLEGMALITAAITAERLAPAAERVARATGAAAIAAGLLLITRAV